MSKAQHKLKVVLHLTELAHAEYEATVTVTTTDTCYREGQLKVGLPPHMAGIPETEYLTFDFTHEGKVCGHIVRDVAKTIKLHASSGKNNVTAFVVVDGEVAGEDSKPAPRAAA